MISPRLSVQSRRTLPLARATTRPRWLCWTASANRSAAPIRRHFSHSALTNTQKSTGPKTPAGKARAARSSLWHGLTAASLVVLDEDEADFDNFHTWLMSDLKPVGE